MLKGKTIMHGEIYLKFLKNKTNSQSNKDIKFFMNFLK